VSLSTAEAWPLDNGLEPEPAELTQDRPHVRLSPFGRPRLRVPEEAEGTVRLNGDPVTGAHRLRIGDTVGLEGSNGGLRQFLLRDLADGSDVPADESDEISLNPN
jgi:hypothetical protein